MPVRANEGPKVPVTPELAGVLQGWIDKAGLKPGDLLFPGEHGGELSSSLYRQQVWGNASPVCGIPAWMQGSRRVFLRGASPSGPA
ncbi:hypothetical protein SSP24_82870 [Streptomyces spinoverrucosus]|uniref:Uncharacterized protein n=1 Tax=Streptomyces spinoverrucosus TaxID=284043 RepID=A0A4Y3VUI2_9ACTN|nr:hypothetical protein SSP24_82870 [Streptomyces spinoverrucosus]GHB51459.1 hypothetical protein GCM10010397_22200 [Streptomyces spinoverrucosus]